MGTLGPARAQANGHKRTQGRLDVRLVAKLKSQSRTQSALLENISKSGARLAVNDPPAAHSEVILQWHGHDMFGQVTWRSETHCGITFRSLAPPAILQATLELDQVAHVPDHLDIDGAAAKAWFDGAGRFGFD